MAKIFISHRGVDASAAMRLATDLESAGHEVWIDKLRLKLGDSIVGEINEGLSRADFVIVCYSAAGTLSPWMSREWMSALARQLEGEAIQVLPVFLSGIKTPAILADIKHVNLARDWAGGLASLLEVLKQP